ncbi:hypothetical protein ACQ4PT_017644 [Festuca glaucescens]
MFEFAKRHNYTEFFLLGSRIIGVNRNRRTIMYDTSTKAFRAGPDLRQAKFIHPAWAAVRGSLYLADVVPPGLGEPCFESLRFDDDGELQDWVWDLLPSPPFFEGTPCGIGSIIRSYAAGDDGTIWLSTLKGTYTFHAGTATWCKEGDWTLPFDGRAQYVPDYGLYFGFTKRSSRLCSAELVAGARASEPPAHRDVWYDVDGYTGTVDDEWPDVDLDAYGAGDGWRLARSYLTCLGGGRFCVTRFYDTTHDQEEDSGCSCNVAVITAVEARHDSSMGALRMIKGASRSGLSVPDESVEARQVLSRARALAPHPPPAPSRKPRVEQPPASTRGDDLPPPDPDDLRNGAVVAMSASVRACSELCLVLQFCSRSRFFCVI